MSGERRAASGERRAASGERRAMSCEGLRRVASGNRRGRAANDELRVVVRAIGTRLVQGRDGGKMEWLRERLSKGRESCVKKKKTPFSCCRFEPGR